MTKSRDDAKLLTTGPSKRGWHRLQLAAECLQKYAWTYKAPQQPEAAPKDSALFGTKSPALSKGSLIHLALAHHYMRMKAVQEGTDPEEWVEPLEAVELIARLNGATEYISLLSRVYEAYVDHWEGEEWQMKILDVEVLFETRIMGKYLLTGRIDLMFEDLDGRIWVNDHKTSSRVTPEHKEFYALSGQLIGYQHLVRQKYGARLAGMKLNLVQVSTEPKFERITLQRSPAFESNFEQIVVDIEESIERMETSGRTYDNWPKAMNELTCKSRYSTCEFADQCRFGAGAKKAGGWSWEG